MAETTGPRWAPRWDLRRRERATTAVLRAPATSRISAQCRARQARGGDRRESWRHGRRDGGGENELTHWTQVLFNVSVVEFVLLAALTALQWVRHRIRGAGWVALSFAILGGVSLAVKIDPSLVTNQNVAKSLIALLLLMPYCLFRFAASFRTPSLVVRALALAVTVGIVAFTFSLHVPAAPGVPATAELPRLPRLLRSGVRLPVQLRRRQLVRGRAGRAADRRHADAPAGHRRGRARGPGGGRRPRAAGARPSGSSRGRSPWSMGVLFLMALVLPLLPAGLLEPQGGRGVPPGHRRARVGRRLEGRGRAPAAPRVRPRGRVEGRPPGQRRHRRGALPGVARQRPVGPVGGGRRRGGREGPPHHGADAQRRDPLAGRQHQPVHAVLRQRRAAQARPAGQHGRARDRALRDGRADGVPGLARRAHRPGQPHPVHGPAGGGA